MLLASPRLVDFVDHPHRSPPSFLFAATRLFVVVQPLLLPFSKSPLLLLLLDPFDRSPMLACVCHRSPLLTAPACLPSPAVPS